MNITQEQMDQDNTKSELINDLIAVSNVMDELWHYHPDNPHKKDIVHEYKVLEEIQNDVEREIRELEG